MSSGGSKGQEMVQDKNKIQAKPTTKDAKKELRKKKGNVWEVGEGKDKVVLSTESATKKRWADVSNIGDTPSVHLCTALEGVFGIKTLFNGSQQQNATGKTVAPCPTDVLNDVLEGLN